MPQTTALRKGEHHYTEIGNGKTYMNTNTKRENPVKRHRGRSLDYLPLALSVAAVTVTLLMVVIVRKPDLISKKQSDATDQNGSLFACVPCAKLQRDLSEDITHDPLLRKLSIEVNDGREDCCAYNSKREQIEALFESVARINELPEQALMSYNVNGVNFTTISAHKRLYPARIVRTFGIPEIPLRPPVCLFKPDDPKWGLEHTRGVDILDRGLRIRHTGLYYVYASILFRPQSLRPCREFKYQTFTAYVQLISRRRATRETILKALHTCCDICINSKHVGFMGGVFVLHQGDVLQVKVMGYELVQFHPHTTFAGLTMMGTPDREDSGGPDGENDHSPGGSSMKI